METQESHTGSGDLFTKADVEKLWALMDIHFDEHRRGGYTPCTLRCEKLALMLAINSVIEDRSADGTLRPPEDSR